MFLRPQPDHRSKQTINNRNPFPLITVKEPIEHQKEAAAALAAPAACHKDIIYFDTRRQNNGPSIVAAEQIPSQALSASQDVAYFPARQNTPTLAIIELSSFWSLAADTNPSALSACGAAVINNLPAPANLVARHSPKLGGLRLQSLPELERRLLPVHGPAARRRRQQVLTTRTRSHSTCNRKCKQQAQDNCCCSFRQLAWLDAICSPRGKRNNLLGDPFGNLRRRRRLNQANQLGLREGARIFKAKQVLSVQFSPMNSNTILVSIERSRDFRRSARSQPAAPAKYCGMTSRQTVERAPREIRLPGLTPIRSLTFPACRPPRPSACYGPARSDPIRPDSIIIYFH